MGILNGEFEVVSWHPVMPQDIMLTHLEILSFFFCRPVSSTNLMACDHAEKRFHHTAFTGSSGHKKGHTYTKTYTHTHTHVNT